MTFETMDWEDEAKRVAAAFGLEPTVHFEDGDAQDLKTLYWGDRGDANDIHMRDGLMFIANYSTDCRFFEILGTSVSFDSWIEIGWDGEIGVPVPPKRMAYAMHLARGLFHLGLLTPKAEVDLQVTTTFHQKLEWTREYDARVGAME
ncbi:MAG: hypothetical protein EOP09_18600 [Proteobacteria bacterium]|nr:MAG: hypothetical protein EOP09_18600 [Pseudomonadota bacterium]